MSLFDSIISGAAERFGLGNKSGTLLSALLSLMTDQNRGGFAGFLDLFSKAGLGDLAASWISSGVNSELSDEQLESALGEKTITDVASQAGVDYSTAKSALAYMIPNVVDKLTPDGVVPEEKDLLTKIGEFLSGIGGAVTGAALGAAGAVGAAASGAADKVGDAAEATLDAGKAVVGRGVEVVGRGVDAVGDAAGATVDAGKAAVGAVTGAAGSALNSVGDVFDGDGDSGGGILKWLLPLILLGLLLLLGFWFCSKPPAPTVPAGNANTNKANTNATTNTNTTTTAVAPTLESSVNVTAKGGKYTLTGVVPDQATKDKILAEAEAVWGKGNVNVDGLKVDAAAKPFASGWFDGFKNLLAGLKDWKDGTISWLGNTLYNVTNLPKDLLSKIGGWFTGWAIPNSLKEITEVSLPDGTKLKAYPGGIEDQLIKFIQSDEYKNGTADSLKQKWFNFDDLNFKFNSTELVPESKRQLDNIVAILKAFPTVKIKIGGYTDKEGKDADNKKLSDDRAKAVKAALEKAGIPAAQVPEAEGYGSEFATLPATATKAEREVDRKTSVRLLK